MSQSHLKKLALTVGVSPGRAPIGRLGRGYRLLWGARHLCALEVLEPLARYGVASRSAMVFARGIADQPSDEVLKAVLSSRPFALIVAPSVCPHTVDEQTARLADEARGPVLKAQGCELVALDLRPLLADLLVRLRATEGVSHGKR